VVSVYRWVLNERGYHEVDERLECHLLLAPVVRPECPEHRFPRLDAGDAEPVFKKNSRLSGAFL